MQINDVIWYVKKIQKDLDEIQGESIADSRPPGLHDPFVTRGNYEGGVVAGCYLAIELLEEFVQRLEKTKSQEMNTAIECIKADREEYIEAFHKLPPVTSWSRTSEVEITGIAKGRIEVCNKLLLQLAPTKKELKAERTDHDESC